MFFPYLCDVYYFMCGVVYFLSKDRHLIQYVEHARKYILVFPLCFIFVSFTVAAL